jgi:hypothetical protein
MVKVLYQVCAPPSSLHDLYTCIPNTQTVKIKKNKNQRNIEWNKTWRT